MRRYFNQSIFSKKVDSCLMLAGIPFLMMFPKFIDMIIYLFIICRCSVEVQRRLHLTVDHFPIEICFLFDIDGNDGISA